MGPISRAIDKLIDKLPRWAQLILLVFVAVGSVYYIAHYGFLTFLLKMIFSPLP
jgi:nitrate reductase NapE component